MNPESVANSRRFTTWSNPDEVTHGRQEVLVESHPNREAIGKNLAAVLSARGEAEGK
jgi:hypothetical protein